jgi:excisionase family DNA binding protein
VSADRLLTLADVAAALGCSLATVKRRVRAGELPAFRDGRIVRVRACDLDRYVLERVRRAAVQAPTLATAGLELPAGRRLWDA